MNKEHIYDIYAYINDKMEELAIGVQATPRNLDALTVQINTHLYDLYLRDAYPEHIGCLLDVDATGRLDVSIYKCH